MCTVKTFGENMCKIRFKKEKEFYHHGNLRYALLTEAAQIIANDGLSGLSLRKLAKICGVSSMALYRHFSNKEALVIAVLEQGYELLQQKFNDIYQQHGDADVIVTLKALGQGYFDFAREHRNFFHLIYGENIFLSQYKEQLNEQANSIFKFLKSILKKGMDGNKIMQQDLESTAFAVWSYLHGITFLFLQGKANKINAEVTPEHFINQLMDYMYLGLNQQNKIN